MAELTHLDAQGNPHMVDVGHKPDTERVAVAAGEVVLSAEALQRIQQGGVQKGDVLLVARLAGIQGAKRASDLIPLCHPLPLDSVSVDIQTLPGRHPDQGIVSIRATVKTRWRTGVEMEALAAVTAAALTVYDMVKAIDRGMRIENVRLLEKRGGRSADWRAPEP